MTGIPMEHGLILAAILFSLGLLWLMTMRHRCRHRMSRTSPHQWRPQCGASARRRVR